MPRGCTVCKHPGRDQIEAELIEGKSYRPTAEVFGVSPAALFRHGRTHLPDRLLKAQDAKETSKGESLVEQIETLQTKAKRILERAESGGDLRTALAGVKELSRLIELVARMTREQFKGADPTTETVESLDDETAAKMAEAFLERRRKEQP